MIYAKVDVGLPRHHRMQALDSASAFGVYVCALCHSREHELDGFVPLIAFRAFPSFSKKDIDELVRVGLFERIARDGVNGVLILKYAEKNETKVDIEERRKFERNRKRHQRDTIASYHARPAAGPSGSPTGTDGGSPTDCPGSLSVSVSDSISSGGVQRGAVGAGMTSLPDDAELTDAHRAVLATVTMNTGVKLELEVEWSKFKAHSRERLKRSGDWLSSWTKWLNDAVKYAKADALRASKGPRAGPPRQKSDPNAPWLNDPAWNGAAK